MDWIPVGLFLVQLNIFNRMVVTVHTIMCIIFLHTCSTYWFVNLVLLCATHFQAPLWEPPRNPKTTVFARFWPKYVHCIKYASLHFYCIYYRTGRLESKGGI